MSTKTASRRASFKSLESANRAVWEERETRHTLQRWYERKLIEERARLLDARDAIERALGLSQGGRDRDAEVVLSAALAKIEARP